MCGGRFHGTCCEGEETNGDNKEIHRICHSCFSKKAETIRNRSRAGKRKATSAGNLQDADTRGRSVNDRDGSRHAKACANRSKSRVRLNHDQRRQVLAGLPDQGAIDVA